MINIRFPIILITSCERKHDLSSNLYLHDLFVRSKVPLLRMNGIYAPRSYFIAVFFFIVQLRRMSFVLIPDCSKDCCLSVTKSMAVCLMVLVTYD